MRDVITTYTFAPGGAGVGTVTLGFSPAPEKVLRIQNQTRGVAIFDPFTPGLGGTVVGAVITLDADTSTHNAADILGIFIEGAASTDLATQATLATRASEATLATRASEATVATRASEATLATRASEATVATLATQATLATRASETTLATRASEATVATLATQATLAAVNSAVGATTDAAAAVDGTNGSVIALLKALRDALNQTLPVSGPLTDSELRAVSVPTLFDDARWIGAMNNLRRLSFVNGGVVVDPQSRNVTVVGTAAVSIAASTMRVGTQAGLSIHDSIVGFQSGQRFRITT
jgi:hypothetical protein